MTTETDIAGRIRHDLFAELKYQTRKDARGAAVQGIQFPRRFVLKWVFGLTWRKTSVGILTASRCRFYSTENLFADAELWAKYDDETHRNMGRCLSYFVNNNNKMLPLSCVNPSQNNKLYMIDLSGSSLLA